MEKIKYEKPVLIEYSRFMSAVHGDSNDILDPGGGDGPCGWADEGG